jgi:hypothetical protein
MLILMLVLMVTLTWWWGLSLWDTVMGGVFIVLKRFRA